MQLTCPQLTGSGVWKEQDAAVQCVRICAVVAAWSVRGSRAVRLL